MIYANIQSVSTYNKNYEQSCTLSAYIVLQTIYAKYIFPRFHWLSASHTLEIAETQRFNKVDEVSYVEID